MPSVDCYWTNALNGMEMNGRPRIKKCGSFKANASRLIYPIRIPVISTIHATIFIRLNLEETCVCCWSDGKLVGIFVGAPLHQMPVHFPMECHLRRGTSCFESRIDWETNERHFVCAQKKNKQDECEAKGKKCMAATNKRKSSNIKYQNFRISEWPIFLSHNRASHTNRAHIKANDTFRLLR